MKLNIKTRLNIGFAIAILLVLAVGIIAFITFNKQYREGELVKHTYQVINQLESIQNSLVDMETGKRGFRSTNDTIFLEPYKKGFQRIEPLLADLNELIKDNPSQKRRTAILQTSVDTLLRFWDRLGNDASGWSADKISQIMSAEKARMDMNRRNLNSLAQAENELLINRENDNNASVELAKWGLVIGILLILCIVILLITQILKEFKNRRIAEADLQKNFKELSLVNQENAERNWLLNGLAKVNNVLQGHLNIKELSEEILNAIVEYVELQAGAFYVYDAEQQKLLLSADFNLSGTEKKEYELKQGLVGRAAVSKEPIVISDIPARYATIGSATVSIEPVHAIYAPLHHDGELKGVIEVLSMKALTVQTTNFLKLVSNNISVALHALHERQKVMELFQQVQKQKEALEHQQEELRQTNEELTVQAEVLQASEEELRVQEEELRQINAELKEKNLAIEEAGRSLSLKAKELEESSKYKSEFLSNMSHELRTPLNSVLILAKLLSDNSDGNLSEKQVTHAKIIQKSGSDLLQLINDILDLSKIESGKVNLHIESVSVKNFVLDLEQLFTVVAEEKNINFTVEVNDHVPEKIKTDLQKVEQVLKNLLSNAFKFTASKGSVSLSFSKVVQNDTTYLAASVKDSGIGIPAAKQQVIFEAFQQADGSTNRKFGGTGLGLSITKELIRLLKGKVQVESKEGVGSTFTAYFPVELEATNSSPVVELQAVKPKQEIPIMVEQTIVPDQRHAFGPDDRVMLIIEDDKDFASILKDFAKSNGFKSIVALSGDEGFYCAKKYHPSAIILDMNLPGINGATLLKMLKEDEELKNIPVHIITGSDDTDLISNSALAFLKKPVQKQDLNNAFHLMSEYLNATVKRVLIFSKNNLKDQVRGILTSEKNYDVICDSATSLEEGIEMLHKQKYDCIIADFGTNIENGISKLTALNAHLQPEHIPTIIYIDDDITTADEIEMKRMADVIVRKSSYSNKRLFDELELFLYKVQEKKKPKFKITRTFTSDGALQNKNVLLVDDDMRNVFALSAALENLQMNVVSANDGKEALDILENNKKIDIVLMDIMMPEMDGYEAISIIRNKMKLHSLPVIALTAKAMSGDREKCLAAGASDYISKPVDVHKLSSLMRVWLS